MDFSEDSFGNSRFEDAKQMRQNRENEILLKMYGIFLN